MSTDAGHRLIDPFRTIDPDEETAPQENPVDPDGGPYDSDGNPIPPKK
jgi:hypothetical protein